MEFKIKTITPVHIGNGETLSPYGDYIKDKDYIYIIDYSKLENYLRDNNESEEMIDEFVEIISKQAAGNKSDRYTIKNFFENNQLNFKEFSSAQIKLLGKINNEEIHQTIKTGNRPIIPGSSIKGAIRTALLYNHLQEDGYKLYEMKKGYTGGEVLGKYGDDQMKYLHVSDSSPLAPDSMVIIHTDRWNLKKKKVTIPLVKEAIPIDQSMNIRIQSKAKSQNNVDTKFNYLLEGNEDIIINKVNKFTKVNLKKEIDDLKAYGKPKLNNIISQYTEIYNKIVEKNSNSMVLRVGAGKTFFNNTIANVLSENDLEKVRKEIDLADYKPFPITRTVVSNPQVSNTLGWIELTKV
ncbi:MAG: type III-A CRISPR-associated RAMP protein Csm5 [Candidatus Woesearchaeota archaeon]